MTERTRRGIRRRLQGAIIAAMFAVVMPTPIGELITYPCLVVHVCHEHEIVTLDWTQ